MYVIFNATMGIAGWSWVAFMLSLGARYLNVKNKLVTYGNEAVLVRPFNLIRFLLGMRPKRKPAAPPAAPPEGFGA